MTIPLSGATLRQLLAIVVSVYGVLSAASVAPHLPAYITTVMTAFAPVILILQHYLADPSTGNPVTQDPAPPTPQA